MKKYSYLFTTLIIFLLILLVAIAFFTYNNYVEYNDRLSIMRSDSRYYTELASTQLKDDLAQVVYDLVLTTEREAVESYFLSEKNEYQSSIEYEFYRMIKYGKPYDQLRFLDVNGVEILRVNNEGDSEPIIVSQENYQDKSSRYYFKEMQTLGDTDIYISAFDLNIENGKIEEPHVPTIRIGKKVYSSFGSHIGYMLVNYNGKEILLEIMNSNKITEHNLFLVNDNGDYIYNPLGKNFNFMFEEFQDEGFKNQYESIWNEITRNDAEIVDESIHSIVDLENFEVINGYKLIPFSDETKRWHLVSVIDENVKSELFYEILNKNLTAYSAIFMLAIAVSFLISYMIWRNRVYQKNLQLIAERDALTGEYNRRLGFVLLEENLNRSRRYQETMALAYIDINDLKYVNDKYGHEFGDRYIRHITETINKEKRESDVLSRIGGDEFILILPNCNEQGAEGLLKRMNESLNIENIDRIYPFCMSFAYGVIEVDWQVANDMDVLLERADEKMYERKQRQKKEGHNDRGEKHDS